jgi:hypothetical protein
MLLHIYNTSGLYFYDIRTKRQAFYMSGCRRASETTFRSHHANDALCIFFSCLERGPAAYRVRRRWGCRARASFGVSYGSLIDDVTFNQDCDWVRPSAPTKTAQQRPRQSGCISIFCSTVVRRSKNRRGLPSVIVIVWSVQNILRKGRSLSIHDWRFSFHSLRTPYRAPPTMSAAHLHDPVYMDMFSFCSGIADPDDCHRNMEDGNVETMFKLSGPSVLDNEESSQLQWTPLLEKGSLQDVVVERTGAGAGILSFVTPILNVMEWTPIFLLHNSNSNNNNNSFSSIMQLLE